MPSSLVTGKNPGVRKVLPTQALIFWELIMFTDTNTDADSNV